MPILSVAHPHDCDNVPAGAPSCRALDALRHEVFGDSWPLHAQALARHLPRAWHPPQPGALSADDLDALCSYWYDIFHLYQIQRHHLDEVQRLKSQLYHHLQSPAPPSDAETVWQRLRHLV